MAKLLLVFLFIWNFFAILLALLNKPVNLFSGGAKCKSFIF
ncbi:hypothetical protein MPNA1381 [Mycoplasmoides pneumoniae 309]|uniref:Uncharacterized protein n=1 Tax=Mycoplasmoides pneumoniae 309 TaxID=1112856 RepID=A0AB33HU56_MYCPM|nr:hypothetical protein MPNA1381 [Mycoplasmoides pneumoniae 309]